MPINRISKNNIQSLYFITPTIQNWYYIFDRPNRWQILADAIIHYQKHNNLEIYAYVFMLNHLHLVVKSPDIIKFCKDFKRYTSKELIKNIKQHEPNILRLFSNENNGYNFWKKDNQPRIIENEKFALQKINYIHNNPVIKGYVEKPEYWKWSSTNPDSAIKICENW